MSTFKPMDPTQTYQPTPSETTNQPTRKRKPPRIKVRPIAEPPTIDMIVRTISDEPDPQTRALASFLYLSGARISEALPLNRDAITFNPTKKTFVARIITLKNRTQLYRRLPLLTKFGEKPLLKYFLDWVRTRPPDAKIWTYASRGVANKDLYNHLAFSTEAMILQPEKRIEVIHKKCNPHFLRHCRATHLARLYKYSTHQLRAFCGWTDDRPGATYVHLQEEDLFV